MVRAKSGSIARCRSHSGRTAVNRGGRDGRRTAIDTRRSYFVGRGTGVRKLRLTSRERAALVGLVTGRARRLEAERSLEELAGLAEAAGAQVVLRMLQERPKPDPSTFLGAGKIEALATSC